MPTSFAETSTGTLLFASGLDPVMRWDGYTSQAYEAGVAAPATAATMAATGAGSITGSYTAYVRYVDNLGNVSNLSPISNEVTAASNLTITYTAVPVPTDPKVVSKQILRNTAGQTEVYYVDVDTTNVSGVTFASTLDDDDLSLETAVALLDDDGNVLANLHGVPPNWKNVVVNHLDRTIFAVDKDYDQGMVQTTFGSTTVTGVGTEWTSSLVGRFLYVTLAAKSYEIVSVNVSAQTMVLLTPYVSATDNFALYAIRPPPAERKLAYYSESALPESVPATNAISIQEDGDELTSAFAMGSFVYLTEKRHVYRWTYQNDPATDGQIFLQSNRGCVNFRCHVVVEDVAYMLDEQGVHAFGAESSPLSNVVQELFSDQDAEFAINWSASEFFHAVHFPQQETIRWYVCMSGNYLPRHCIALNYRQQRWWIEEYPFVISSSATGVLGNQPQVFLGSDAERVFAYWKGTLDGPDPANGTVRGTVTSASTETLVDSAATFPTTGVVGNPIVITSGIGKGQRRIVTAVSGTTIRVDQPWLIRPDTTSVYQLGGIQWTWRSGDFKFSQAEEMVQRKVSVVFEPADYAAFMDMRIFYDSSDAAVEWKGTYTSAEGNNVAVTDGDEDIVVDLMKTSGFCQKQLPGHREHYIDGPRYVAVELAGVTNKDKEKIYTVQLDGVTSGR